MYTAEEIGIDDFQATRSPTGRYRTAPLKGLFAHEKAGLITTDAFPRYARWMRDTAFKRVLRAVPISEVQIVRAMQQVLNSAGVNDVDIRSEEFTGY